VSTAVPSTSSATGPSASPSKAASAQWAGTTQFLQIGDSRKADGVQYLEVKEAKKDGTGKAFKTVSLDGPWINVVLSDKAVNDPKSEARGDSAKLRAALAERTKAELSKGFDLTFDDQGQVSKVTWLYVSTRETTQAALAKWAGSEQFLQIDSARVQGDVTYLKVRPAEKEYLGESFETKTIGGPWIEVVMSALAVNAPLGDEIQGDASQLRKELDKRRKDQTDEGFDITFSQNGQVSKVTWLYVPSGY
jgi:hypothetical protein